jgi:hypothetical protein
MPPWHADSSVLRYSNDLSLSAAQRETLIAWVDSGAAAGDASDAPPPKPFVDGWRIAKPDAIFQLPEPFEVPRQGVVEYQYFTVPTNFPQDVWVEMAEVRPTARAVVHHAIVSVRAPTEAGLWGGHFLAGYAPGSAPQIWKPGQARLVPAGSHLVFQMHYTANGKAASDRTQIGLVFARQRPKERAVAIRAINSWFLIPAGAPNHRVTASATVHDDARLAAIRPHMHLRGKSFEEARGTEGSPIRLPLPALLLSGDSHRPACRITARLRRALRQLREQSAQSRSVAGCGVGRTKLGRDDDRLDRRAGRGEAGQRLSSSLISAATFRASSIWFVSKLIAPTRGCPPPP